MESTAVVNARNGLTIGQRLVVLMGDTWTLGKLADRSGVSKAQLSLLTRDLIEHPRVDTLEKIAAAMRMKLTDITGETDPTPQVTIYAGVAWVPYVERSVHAGADPWRESAGRTPLSEEEARGHRRLYAGRVAGSCMVPDVVPDATVIWDPDMRHPADGQMVVVSVNGELMVKMAYRDADGVYVLVSNDGREVYPNGVVLEGVVVKITNNPRRGPRSLAEWRALHDPKDAEA